MCDNKFTVQSIQQGIRIGKEMRVQNNFGQGFIYYIAIFIPSEREQRRRLGRSRRTFISEEIFAKNSIIQQNTLHQTKMLPCPFTVCPILNPIESGQRTTPQNILAISSQFIGFHFCHPNFSGIPFSAFQHFPSLKGKAQFFVCFLRFAPHHIVVNPREGGNLENKNL